MASEPRGLARGQFEILAKKGEGLKRIIEACGGAKEAFQLLMLEHFDNLVDASAKAISNIKFDKVVVWENGVHNGTTSTASFLQNMARTMPPMMQVLKEIGGVELPESLIKFTGDGEPTARENGQEVSGTVADAKVPVAASTTQKTPSI
jgi:flotillin